MGTISHFLLDCTLYDEMRQEAIKAGGAERWNVKMIYFMAPVLDTIEMKTNVSMTMHSSLLQQLSVWRDAKCLWMNTMNYECN